MNVNHAISAALEQTSRDLAVAQINYDVNRAHLHAFIKANPTVKFTDPAYHVVHMNAIQAEIALQTVKDVYARRIGEHVQFALTGN